MLSPRTLLVLATLLSLLAVASLTSLSIGPGGLINPLACPDESIGLLRYRLVRLSAGIVAGLSLGVAGLSIQRVTRNPLADPYLMGVSSGAVLGVLTSIAVGLSPHLWPLSSFVGGLFALLLAMTLSTLAGYSPLSLIVAGVAVSYLLYSINLILLSLMHSKIKGSPMMWLFGSLAYVRLDELLFSASLALLGVAVILTLHRELDVLVLEDDVARALGVRCSLVRALAIGGATMATAAITAVTGPVGFVGVTAPWLARVLTRGGFIELSLASGLLGATIVVSADTAIKALLGGLEVPITAVTALVGVPLLVYFISRIQGG
ncbi:MAG: iron ABC transporter permease [Acidilobaceae archaeon]